MPAVARPGNANSPAPASLSAVQIVQQMQQRNLARKEELKHFHDLRHYHVEYRGYSARVSATMDVEVTYDASSGKTFRILSQSGSKLLFKHVLKRLIQSEEEAGREQKSTALTPANYSFQLAGNDTIQGRPAYILHVEPLVPSKFLYKGKIWVDAADFAVERIDAEPAKNPSFWITRTQIRHQYTKTGDFWLPHEDRSETDVRVGGKAVLTIDYGTYQVEPAPLNEPPQH